MAVKNETSCALHSCITMVLVTGAQTNYSNVSDGVAAIDVLPAKS